MRPNDRLRPINILLVNADVPNAPPHIASLDPSAFKVTSCTDDWERSIVSEYPHFDLIIACVSRSFTQMAIVLSALRRDGCLNPVIVISVPEQRKRCIELLDAGADDFVFEGIDRSEIAARIFAVLRKANYIDAPVKVGGRLSIAVATVVDWTKLTLREALVFRLLLSKHGAIVSKSEIQQALYDGRIIESNAIEAAIYALRRKLSRDAILTRRNLGYALNLRNIESDLRASQSPLLPDAKSFRTLEHAKEPFEIPEPTAPTFK